MTTAATIIMLALIAVGLGACWIAAGTIQQARYRHRRHQYERMRRAALVALRVAGKRQPVSKHHLGRRDAPLVRQWPK